MKFETKKISPKEKYLWVDGHPVGHIPINMPINETVAYDLYRIQDQAFKMGMIRGRDEERKRINNILFPENV